ncbi:MAG: endopeptidase La [Bacilli bacterium]|nr:endopeptidase La [Bacilli bacterium]
MAENNKLILPLLMTRGIILFPGHTTHVDAAREYSTRAIDEARNAADDLIIIVSQINPEIDNPNPVTDIYKVGTVCKIQSFSQQKGYIRVKLEPLSRVQIESVNFDDGKFFLCQASLLEDEIGDHTEEVAIVRNIIQTLEGSSDFHLEIPRQVINQLSKGVSAPELANALSNYLPMSLAQRQKLLEEVNLNNRLKAIYRLINEEKQIAIIDRKLEQEVRDNAEKSQKEYFLREKMRAIKNELGENPDDEKSVENIRKRVEENPYPDFVKNKVKSELKRFEMMPQASLEASLILNYIDWMMDTPWYQKTEDNDDLNNVQKILDEDHYGLEEPKKRIIEYLAVKKMTNSLKAPILCFYGPPGVGKTSLGRSIARALGRKYFKVSLGGISDEAEIRGHRRTYVGSMPGRIINGMKKAGVINPVFLLDEVDKLASSYKGDPASALLEVLDPEQNYAFNDNYLEEPFDLSNVLFIATANQIENVPGPLRDRLEIIEVNSYTEIEKIHIAEDHLIPKQIEANGLNKDQISFTTEAVKFIIERYTREAGVRDLERKIGSCVRKVVVELLKDPKVKSIVVSEKEVRSYLGIEKFDDSKKEKVDQIGVVTGLAYTQFGGDILPIEVNYFKGKGQLVLTGSLGDVMKESSAIAFDYVKANAEKYNIDTKLFTENDVHVHFPEGAIPKDGPSAGVAITLAIISALSGRKVNANVAMTGEVTLRGKALAIGGLREKSLAASRCGIKTIIIPRENEKNLEDLPQEVKNKLEIKLMDCVDDAVAIALRD